MSETLSLFPEPGPSPDLQALREQIAALAALGVFIGTSSWKYEGWLGQIYTASRYEHRGKFSSARFERECIAEYAETFKTVCFDGAYYTWPSEKNLVGLAAQVPDDFRFAFKVTDATTIKRFPNLPRFGASGGKLNEEFLNAPLFIERFLGPLSAIRQKVGPVIFEFSKFHPAEYANVSGFIADLDQFLSALPSEWAYSVELRNKTWLVPEYLDMLKKHEVAHVFNSWTHAAPVAEQVATVGDRHTDRASVSRLLLKPGRDYETAVGMFKPYGSIKEPLEDIRKIAAELIRNGTLKQKRNGTWVYINNRLEGSAPDTVKAILAMLNNPLFAVL